MADQSSSSSSGILSNFSDASVESLLDLARITETAERFEDMCEIMGQLVKTKAKDATPLEVEERNMLSVAYKNVVGQRRASWRTLKNEDDGQSTTPESAELKGKYKEIVEKELEQKCREVLTLLETNLVKDKEDSSLQIDETKQFDEAQKTIVETQVFYLKMCGDYHRYLAEFRPNDAEIAKKASTRYDEALNLAKKVLQPTHPTRLGLALNASVCYYEILKKPKIACELAKSAFDEAIQKLDSLSDSTYKDSTLIMQLLRDNLTIWTSEDAQTAAIEDRED